MILLPWFSSATLTAASNPTKGQGLPHSGFTETCAWSTSRSSFSVIPEVITQDSLRDHTLWVLKGTHTPLRADGCCVILLFPHQDLGHITCVWTTLFQTVPDFCSEPAAYLSPSRTNSQPPGFLLKATPTISSISEKEMQEDQCAFLFPWGWLLFVRSDSHKARTQVPAMGCSFFLSPWVALELPRLFVQKSAPHSWQ